MDIQTMLLGKNEQKIVNGHVYPALMADAAIIQFETLLSQGSYVRVKIDLLADPFKEEGWLCVHGASHKVGLAQKRGVKHAIAPLRRTDIINIIADGSLVYTESLDGI